MIAHVHSAIILVTVLTKLVLLLRATLHLTFMSNEPQAICQIKKKCQTETIDVDFKPEEQYLFNFDVRNPKLHTRKYKLLPL